MGKVHHGANRYCLDKNYAGVLIIWDRLFGTFEAEKPDVKIVYGLVDQPQFWNPLKHQVFYYGKVWEKAMTMTTWGDFFSAFFKGPGWFPGTERLGDITFVPENPVRDKYDVPVSPLLHIYTIGHFITMFLVSDFINGVSKITPLFSLVTMVLYNVWGLTNIGLLYENRMTGWLSELVRCVTSLIMFSSVSNMFAISSVVMYRVFTLSTVVSSAMVLGGSFWNKQKLD